MQPNSDPPRSAYRPYPQASRASLVLILLVMAVPIIIVAAALGGRPPGFGVADLLRLGGGPATAPPVRVGWALPEGQFFGEGTAPSGEGEVHGYAVTDADGISMWSAY